MGCSLSILCCYCCPKYKDLIESAECLLEGDIIIGDNSNICDYTLEQQMNDFVETDRQSVINFVPIIGETVNYSVMAIILNEGEEVLMAEETVPKRRWFPPSGSVGPNETIYDCVKRIVVEKTGIYIKPTYLVKVKDSISEEEGRRQHSIRFIFTAMIIGGTLKTTSEADDHSLQAVWLKNCNHSISRKCKNKMYTEFTKESPQTFFVTLFIDNFLKSKQKVSCPKRQLPIHKAHKKLLLRLFIISDCKMFFGPVLRLLMAENPRPHLPICQIYPNTTIECTLGMFLKHIFGSTKNFQLIEVLGVEHNFYYTDQHNGICITLLIKSLKSCRKSTAIGYTWLTVCNRFNKWLTPKLKTWNTFLNDINNSIILRHKDEKTQYSSHFRRNDLKFYFK